MNKFNTPLTKTFLISNTLFNYTNSDRNIKFVKELVHKFVTRNVKYSTKRSYIDVIITSTQRFFLPVVFQAKQSSPPTP